MNIVAQKTSWPKNYNVGYNGLISRKRDFVAAGINWFSRWDEVPDAPPVSHAFIICGPDRTIEAFPTGVAYGSLNAYLMDPNVAVLVRRPKRYSEALGKRIVAEAEKHLGDKYDFGLIVADALANTFLGHWINQLTGGWPNRMMCRILGRDARMICSELVATADHQPELLGGGVLAQPAATVTPQMILADQWVFEPGACELVP